VDVYTDELEIAMGEKEVLVLSLLFSMFGVISLFFSCIIIPLFFRLNNLRRLYWIDLVAGFRIAGHTISARCVER
jgi:hypothetical protein